MKGFVRIDKLSLQQCACLLSNETDSIKKQALESQCKLLIKERNKQEEKEFKECKTITDYDRFLKEYDVDYYSMLHKDDVNKEIEKIIADISLQGYYELLLEDSMRPYAERIKKEIDKHLPIWQKEEKFAYEQCKTINDYEQFITKYSKYASFYAMQYKVAAEQKIEDIFWSENNDSSQGCRRYLACYPKGRYVSDATGKINRIKFIRRSVFLSILLIVILILIAICCINYKTSDFELSSDSLSFSKYGGEQTITIMTKTTPDACRCHIGRSMEWLSKKKNDYDITFTAEANHKPEKSGDITICAYPTLFGMVLPLPPAEKKISVIQKSGIPSYLKVLPKDGIIRDYQVDIKKNGLRFDKWGHNRDQNTFIVETDGVGLDITSKDWIHVRLKTLDSTRTECVVKLDTNKTEGNRNALLSISIGHLKEEVPVVQESGLANFIYVNSLSHKTYYCDKDHQWICCHVTTDGTIWNAECSESWLTVQKDNDEQLCIEVEKNEGKVKSGIVDINSNNGYTATITIWQDGNPNYLNLSKSNYTFDTYGGTANFYIDTDSKLPVTCWGSHKWMDQSVDNQRITITCNENVNDPPKDGKVHVICGDLEEEISIHQKGWKDCDYCGGDGRIGCDDPNNSDVWEYEYFDAAGNGCNQKLIHGHIDWSAFPRYRSVRCSRCGGSGQIDCRHCGGEGKVKIDYERTL